MKKFILTIFLFLFPLVIFLGLLEIGVRHIPNDYQYKNEWLEQNISTVKILSYGSSHGHLGIRPSYFKESAFNVAHVSQSIKYDAFLFRKFIDRADSLKYVIWPISYFSLPGSMDDGDEWWRAKNYYIYYDCPYRPMDVRFHSAIFGTNLKLAFDRVKNYIIFGYDEIMSDSLGWQMGNTKTNRAIAWTNNGKDRAARHTQNLNQQNDIIINNKRIVKDVIQQCAEKGVHVLLLTTPTFHTYYDNIDKKQYELMTNFCDSLSVVYDNVEYMNLFQDSRFEEDDFFDADHMEAEGAIKLTKIIDEYIHSANVFGSCGPRRSKL